MGIDPNADVDVNVDEPPIPGAGNCKRLIWAVLPAARGTTVSSDGGRKICQKAVGGWCVKYGPLACTPDICWVDHSSAISRNSCLTTVMLAGLFSASISTIC